MEPERREGGAGERVDISRDFCCFLCNGFVVIQGLITLQPSFVRLSTCVGGVLEEFEYSSVHSVNEEEPPTTHSLIFNLPHHSVYVCHLLRKELLLKVFRKLGVYKPDEHLPAESLGFPAEGKLTGRPCTRHTARLVLPRNMHMCHHPHHHHHHHTMDHHPHHTEGHHHTMDHHPHHTMDHHPHHTMDHHPHHMEGHHHTMDHHPHQMDDHTGSHSEWQIPHKSKQTLFPPTSQEGGLDHTPSGVNNLHTSASGALVSNHTHFNNLASSSHSQISVEHFETTPLATPNRTTKSDQQLRDLCALFPHLSEERLRGVLVEVGGDSDKAIETLTDTDQLANAPLHVTLSHTM